MLTITNNEMINYNISLSQSNTNGRARGIRIENNKVYSITIDNSSDVMVSRNRFRYLNLTSSDSCNVNNNLGWTWAADSFSYRITMNNCKDLVSFSNLFYVHETNSDTLMKLHSNRTPSYRDDWGFIMRDCRKSEVYNNKIYNSYGIYNLRGDSLRVSKNYTYNSYLDRGYGLYFEGLGSSVVADSNQINNQGVRYCMQAIWTCSMANKGQCN